MATSKRRLIRRRALFVLGMHRSGTSALGGVLAKLGAQPPKSLMEPTAANPRGYWESSALMQAHDQMLRAAGSRWNDWGPFNPDWVGTEIAAKFHESVEPLVKQEFGDHPLILIKDPRICRFFPFWLEILKKLKITAQVIIPVRHPLDVARSLELRDHFSRDRSYLLWLRHMLDAEASSRTVTRTFVGYDHLLDNWKDVAGKIAADLDLKWPKMSGDTDALIADFLSTELRHHHSTGEPVAASAKLSGWIGTTHHILNSLANGAPESDTDRETLDRIRNEFDRTSGVYAAVVREHETRVEALYADVKARLAERTKELQDLSSRHEEVVRGHAQGENALAQQRDERLQANLIHEHKEALSRATAVLAEKTAACDAISSRYDKLADEVLGQTKELVATHHALATANASGEAQARDLANLREAVARLEAELTRAHESETGLEELLQVRTSESGKLNDAVEHQKQDLAELRDKLRGREKAIEVRFQETAKLTRMVLELEQAVETKDKLLSDAETMRRAISSERDKSVEQEQKTLLALEESEQKMLLALEESRRKAVLSEYRLAIDSATDRQLSSEYRAHLERIVDSRLWKLHKSLGRSSIHAEVEQSLAPRARQRQVEQEGKLRDCGLFDEEWYLSRYPEVRESGLEPIGHYLLRGAPLGFDPGPGFETLSYLARYPDVRHSGINPLLHYIEHGRQEGRIPSGRDNTLAEQ